MFSYIHLYCINVNPFSGFGVSAMTSLVTFQPFFLSLHLPYSAVRGERLPVIFTVYNYLDKCLHIQLTLDAVNMISTSLYFCKTREQNTNILGGTLFLKDKHTSKTSNKRQRTS